MGTPSRLACALALAAAAATAAAPALAKRVYIPAIMIHGAHSAAPTG